MQTEYISIELEGQGGSVWTHQVQFPFRPESIVIDGKEEIISQPMFLYAPGEVVRIAVCPAERVTVKGMRIGQ